MKSNCIECGANITYQPSQSTGKFCSNKCQHAHQFKLVKEPEVGLGTVSNTPTLRRYLMKHRGASCEKCGTSDWMNAPITLQVDHIDGNSDNNLPVNLRLLCPNCHSQTDTFCGRNLKNSSRATYKRRYRIRNLVDRKGLEPPVNAM